MLKSFENDVNKVVGLIALGLLVGAIAWFLEILLAILTSPMFLVAASVVAVGGLSLWVYRVLGNGGRNM